MCSKKKTDAHRNVRTSACHFGDQTEVRHAPIQEIPVDDFIRPVDPVEPWKEQGEIDSQTLFQSVHSMISFVRADVVVHPITHGLHLNLEELPPPEYR